MQRVVSQVDSVGAAASRGRGEGEGEENAGQGTLDYCGLRAVACEVVSLDLLLK